MSQRTVESVIGRLVTDDDFRERFRRDPHACLDDVALAAPLTPSEREALAATDVAHCGRVADHLHPRLVKICLNRERAG
jgi:hypothetical protein